MRKFDNAAKTCSDPTEDALGRDGEAARVLAGPAISSGVCQKMQTRRFGGYGYGHLLGNIFPSLRREGVSDELLTKLIVDNPRGYMTIA